MKTVVRIGVGICIFAAIGWFFAQHMMRSSQGDVVDSVTIVVPEGATVRTIAEILSKEELIANEWAFVAYMRLYHDGGALKAGTYTIAPGLTIPDIVTLLSEGKGVRRDKRITFPEGWRIEQVAERLTKEGFDGDAFLEIAFHPSEDLRAKYDFLTSLPEGMSLEGYLFPDTYDFLPEATAEEIVDAMLVNFGRKFTQEMRSHIAQFPYSLHEVVTLASIIEREVHVAKDRPIVGGIFYNRLRDGIALGSDATLDYIFGESKIKHTLEETRVDSPYNTYKNVGLPPGPIGNPGANALHAAVYPAKTDFFYFLNNAQTGKTVFSRTYKEHLVNKEKNGL